MGQLMNKCISQRVVRVHLIGVRKVGKFTLANKWRTGQILLKQYYTVNFCDYDEFIFQDCVFQVFSYPLIEQQNYFFSTFWQKGDQIIVLVDSSQLLQKNLLNNVLQAGLLSINQVQKPKKIPILIVANKKDLCKYSDKEIVDHVGVDQFPDNIYYKLIHTNCFSGEGLDESLQWLMSNNTN